MRFFEFITDMWRGYGWSKPGKAGQIVGGTVFCPLYKKWIGTTLEIEISASRTQYDEIVEPLELKTEADDFNRALKNSGWKIPAKLGDAILTCQYCEVYCLGKGGIIPELGGINKKELVHKLHGREQEQGTGNN